MDPGVRERFLHWLDREATSSKDDASRAPAIVFVTHHVEEIMPSFDRTLMMQAGRIVAAGATNEVVIPERIASAYGVGVQRLESAGGRLWPIWAVH
jgi:iron complex transport system ATP-binding protein